MARSCSSSAAFTSFTGASPCSSSSSSSPAAPSSLSLQQVQRELSSLSYTNKHTILRWECEKSPRKASHAVVIARHGQYDKPSKNISQRGSGEGGRYANVATKEDKAGNKGRSSGGRNPKPYNSSNSRSYKSSSSSNSRPYNNSSNSNPRSQNSHLSRKMKASKSVGVGEYEDEEEEFTFRNPSSNNKAGKSSRSSVLSNARSRASRVSVLSDDEEEDEDDDSFEFDEDNDFDYEDHGSPELSIMPIPPAGFVLAEDGSVSLMAPPHKRITTLVDHETEMPLDCLIRRIFSSSDGRQCFLLCPLDTPLQILRIDDGDTLKELQISDEELEDIFPTASYELAKQRLHLVKSGFCLTLRGGFCFNEEDVIDLSMIYGDNSDTKLNEGVEIGSFVVNDSEYVIFTPFDPLMFVAYKDEKTGELLIADDDLLDDDAVLDAIDEEKEFQAYMEEDMLIESSSDEEEE